MAGNILISASDTAELDSAYQRELNWSNRTNMKETLRKLKVSIPEVDKLCILVHGPVGAGKSSFINSIDSIFQERMTCIALTGTATARSFTKTYKRHKIKNGEYGAHLSFEICDTMGLENGTSVGLHSQDLVQALEGHLKDGYKFNPLRPCSISEKKYNKYQQSDRIHCLVSVLPVNISTVGDGIISKMKDIREKAAEMCIPQFVILTKVDEICPQLKKDIQLIYTSTEIMKKMQECSRKLGIPPNCIFPVKCYHEEIDLIDNVDVLLLYALTFILNAANDHVAQMTNDYVESIQHPKIVRWHSMPEKINFCKEDKPDSGT